MDQISVGIDVSKAMFVVAVSPTGERWTSDTDPTAIDALVTRLQRLTPAVMVVEATGGYERALVAACAAAGLPVAIVNPRQVRAFAQALGLTAKTDDIDADVLAAFGARVQPTPRPLARCRHAGLGRARGPAAAADRDDRHGTAAAAAGATDRPHHAGPAQSHPVARATGE